MDGGRMSRTREEQIEDEKILAWASERRLLGPDRQRVTPDIRQAYYQEGLCSWIPTKFGPPRIAVAEPVERQANSGPRHVA
jgi:hypothetical protein